MRHIFSTPKKIINFILVLSLLISLVPASVFATNTDAISTTQQDQNTKSIDSDQALLNYINSQLLPKTRTRFPKRAMVSRRNAGTLSPNEQSVYDQIMEQVPALLNGTSPDGSTAFKIDASQFPGVKLTYTEADLGFDIFDEANNTYVNEDKVKTFITDTFAVDGSKLYYSLHDDHPEKFFWDFGLDCYTDNRPVSYSTSAENGGEVTINPNFTYSLPVSVVFRPDGADASEYEYFYIDTTKLQSINAAIANAKQIVADAESLSDYEKLKYYYCKICALTDYNWTAYYNYEHRHNEKYSPKSDINPWELIWALDGNPDTKVVCEGYARAYQYLCNMSTFQDKTVECRFISGVPEGSGGHAWNLVELNGKNYHVDTTWGDKENADPDMGYFLGYGTPLNGGYKLAYNNKKYGISNNEYTAEELTIATEPYDPNKTSETIPVTALAINPATIVLTTGDTTQLTVSITPSDATDPSVTYTSSDASIASVSDTGLVTAIAPGTATITATSVSDPTITAVSTVTVSAPAPVIIPVTDITITPSTLTLTEGDTTNIIATVLPNDATDKSVSFTSSNEAIASVDASGLVTAHLSGSAIITVKAGDTTKTVAVTVNPKIIPVTDITLNPSTLTLTEGDEADITASITPNDSTDKSITWTVDKPDILTLTNDGHVIANQPGDAVVTATATNGVSASVPVHVEKRIIPITSITLSESNLTLTEGESKSLVATVNPDNATYPELKYTSSDPDTAFVSSTGQVTAEKEGSAVITVSSVQYPDIKTTCSVTVKAKPPVKIAVSKLTLSDSHLTLTEDDEADLTATIAPENATNKSLRYDVDKSGIITLDQTGHIKAMKAGKCLITVTPLDAPELSKTCSVTVKAKKTESKDTKSDSKDSSDTQNDHKSDSKDNTTTAKPVFTLNKRAFAITSGDSDTLLASVTPATFDLSDAVWQSSDTNVLTINAKSGKLRALKPGQVTVTLLSATTGEKYAVCDITVEAKEETNTGSDTSTNTSGNNSDTDNTPSGSNNNSSASSGTNTGTKITPSNNSSNMVTPIAPSGTNSGTTSTSNTVKPSTSSSTNAGTRITTPTGNSNNGTNQSQRTNTGNTNANKVPNAAQNTNSAKPANTNAGTAKPNTNSAENNTSAAAQTSVKPTKAQTKPGTTTASINNGATASARPNTSGRRTGSGLRSISTQSNTSNARKTATQSSTSNNNARSSDAADATTATNALPAVAIHSESEVENATDSIPENSTIVDTTSDTTVDTTESQSETADLSESVIDSDLYASNTSYTGDMLISSSEESSTDSSRNIGIVFAYIGMVGLLVLLAIAAAVVATKVWESDLKKA